MLLHGHLEVTLRTSNPLAYLLMSLFPCAKFFLSFRDRPFCRTEFFLVGLALRPQERNSFCNGGLSVAGL